ncbi:putative allantoin permease [Naematelia encephala]|uniref:Putative allantoin permease n=1 Tax=Naematelia encephala TaxID=71784 RepID=A0A1Y2AW37_9TREE|nr:putative allantoin permease [Naematelia encephala]
MFFARLKKLVQVEETEEMKQSTGKTWTNADLAPNPPETRRWDSWSFFLFQFSISFSPTTYNAGASLVASGLLWWHIFLAAWVGSILCCILVVMNARGPSRYHIGFPSFVRISAGLRGSLLWVFIRGVVAILYMATQTLYAGYLMDVCLRCVFGHKWTDIPNHLPASSGTTSRKLLAFFILWFIQFPFMFIHPSKTGPIFAAKSFIVVPSLFATMAWAVHHAGGAHLDKLVVTTVTGSQLGWGFMRALNSTISNVLPPLVNIADLARYANHPKQTWTITYGLFISKPIVILIGMIIASCGKHMYGTTYWNLWDFFNATLDHNWNAGARTLVFLAALTQVYATFVTNISSNSIPVGCDLAGLFPRYFTIVRGQILCAILAIAVVPWKIVSSAQQFLTFLNSYICFICPILAIEIVDYWFVRRGNVHMPSVFLGGPQGIYWYWHGINPRAYAAWIIGVVLVVHGVANALHPHSLNAASTDIYNMGFILSTLSAGIAYYLICLVFPVKIMPDAHADEPVTWERLGSSEGFFPDDLNVPEYIAFSSHGMSSSVEEESEGKDEKTIEPSNIIEV